MRPLLAIALLLPAIASANPQWLFADGYEGSTGMDEVVMLSYWAILAFAYFAYQALKERQWLRVAFYVCAGVGAVAFPQLFGIIFFVVITALIILIGIGH